MSLSIEVAICTYNNAQLLDRALATITEQRVDLSIRWSVLVVDNNSTDETAAIAQNYLNTGKIPQLRLIHEPQQGLSYARICAVRSTNCELIAFVDDDCLLSPNWVQQAVTFFQEHPQAGAVGSRVKLLWEVPPPEEVLPFQGYLSAYDRGDLPLQMPSEGNTYLVGAGLVVRRSALLASGWLEKTAMVGRNGKKLTAGDDSEIVLRIRNAGYELWYNSAMQLQHYIPKRRISPQYLQKLVRGIGQSQPFLYLLGNRLQPNLAVRLSTCGNSIHYFSKVLATIVYRYFFQPRSLTTERLIYLNHSLGKLEGAIQLLLKGNQA
ncbi:MAG: glycosyltransferase [Oscillatoria sp. PMC 1068.18]|nr:glycosyltransferase [Oscillatoria sp. PMC 1076.18]MEC4991626.1 glycosyltransferase [Oscillatoria sp. PMC 1068.18]